MRKCHDEQMFLWTMETTRAGRVRLLGRLLAGFCPKLLSPVAVALTPSAFSRCSTVSQP